MISAVFFILIFIGFQRNAYANLDDASGAYVLNMGVAGILFSCLMAIMFHEASKNLIKKLARPFSSTLNLLYLAPYLFGLIPVLFLVSRNWKKMVWDEVWCLLVIIGLCVTILIFLFRFLFRSTHAASLTLSMVLLLVFSFGHFLNAFGSVIYKLHINFIDGQILYAVWIFLLISAAYLIPKLVRFHSRILKMTNAAAIYLSIVSFVPLNSLYPPYETKQTSFVRQSEFAEKYPDIYFIVLSAYGSEKMLKRVLNVDNSKFVAFLRSRGFVVSDESYANYMRTILSHSSILNMNYVNETLKEFDTHEKKQTPFMR